MSSIKQKLKTKTPKDKNIVWLSMEFAPKDRTIVVFDPKPSVHYGPDIHAAKWSDEHGAFIATNGACVDPLDISPECFTYDIKEEELK